MRISDWSSDVCSSDLAMLREKGISKRDLTREQFMEHAWEWKKKYGGIILEQLKKLGASCDWERQRFTMDPALSDAVIDTFIHLHKKGLLYRSLRMVNWDPVGRTAVSDEEVIRTEVNQKIGRASSRERVCQYVEI